MDKLLKGFSLVICLVALIYTLFTLHKVYSWFTYSASTTPTSVALSVKQFSDEEFRIHARYQFLGETHEETWETPTFKNSFAAEHEIKTLSPTTVWYNPRDLSHSTLQKSFPLKQCIYSALLWAIGGYFWILPLRLKKAH